jgi:hypothetical protein
MGRITTALLTAMLVCCAGVASAQCAPKKGPVHDYLKAHANYHLVDLTDLGDSDRLAWRRLHHGLCPGLATIALGGGEKSYALAVTTKGRNGRLERLVLLQADGARLIPKTLVPAFAVGDPLVVWRAKPRTVREFGSRRRIALAHDSIMFEKLGLSAKVFHLADGKIQTVLMAY